MCAMRGFSVRRFGFVSRQPSGRFCCVGVGDCSVAAAFHEVPPVKKRMVTCTYFTYCREGGGGGNVVAFLIRDFSTTGGKLT